ncbi:hypothetical protein V6N13_061167 [Hibiscus sabdariffa]|uniref:Uncharacterized protein n=1 Tax=Hibiscus sabdariffa TaxID=183260 RepID=A0ABR2EHT3_9ROSI
MDCDDNSAPKPSASYKEKVIGDSTFDQEKDLIPIDEDDIDHLEEDPPSPPSSIHAIIVHASINIVLPFIVFVSPSLCHRAAIAIALSICVATIAVNVTLNPSLL